MVSYCLHRVLNYDLDGLKVPQLQLAEHIGDYIQQQNLAIQTISNQEMQSLATKIEEEMFESSFNLLEFLQISLKVIQNKDVFETLSNISLAIKSIYEPKTSLEGEEKGSTQLSIKQKTGSATSPKRQNKVDDSFTIFLPLELLPNLSSWRTTLHDAQKMASISIAESGLDKNQQRLIKKIFRQHAKFHKYVDSIEDPFERAKITTWECNTSPLKNFTIPKSTSPSPVQLCYSKEADPLKNQLFLQKDQLDKMMATVFTSSLSSLVGLLTQDNLIKSYYRYGNNPQSNSFHLQFSPIFNFIKTVVSNFVLQNLDEVIYQKHLEIFKQVLDVYGSMLDCLSGIHESRVIKDGLSNGFQVFYTNFLSLEIEAFLATLDQLQLSSDKFSNM